MNHMNPINPVGNPQWKDLPSDVIKKVASEVNGLTLCHLSQLSKSTRDITAQEFRVREMRSAKRVRVPGDSSWVVKWTQRGRISIRGARTMRS